MKTTSPVTIAIVVVLNFLALSSVGQAGCKGDCREEYESEVESCHLLYSDADDADDLQQCVQSAKEDYDACIDDCEN